MIGLDTNVLVRYLTQDDPVQSAKATEILERRLTPKIPGFVSVVAMVETVWVLDRAYGLTAQEIATTVERLLQVEVLAIENEQEVFTAMVALKQGRGSFRVEGSFCRTTEAKSKLPSCRSAAQQSRKRRNLPLVHDARDRS